ncbi:MAG: type II toxin-antitoxin system RelE/ParE family toxin [Acidobacteriia bacterium]|nr:type II toxin-antitoxin system RelE/ParE family toxin [Terriglobia bacterium]
MIRSIRHKGLRRLYEEDHERGINAEHAEKLRDILARLDAAESVEDLNLPGFRLHALKGDLKGCWAITVRANWRVVFRFEDGEAHELDYGDYH